MEETIIETEVQETEPAVTRDSRLDTYHNPYLKTQVVLESLERYKQSPSLTEVDTQILE